MRRDGASAIIDDLYRGSSPLLGRFPGRGFLRSKITFENYINVQNVLPINKQSDLINWS